MHRLARCTALLLTPPFAAPVADITVFAAFSLKTALDQIAADFQTSTGITVSISKVRPDWPDRSSRVHRRICSSRRRSNGWMHWPPIT